MIFPFNDTIQSLFKIFNRHEFQLYLVGGCVRDFLMKQPFNDFDLTSDATPEEMMELASQYDIKVFPTGLKHGTLTFIMNSIHIEITTFRQEKLYIQNRFPKEIIFTKCLEEDVKRRDFTINALALDENKIYDYFNGQRDIEDKIIRCVGDPSLRFQEDALRILRGLRFSFKLDFSIEAKTWLAIQENAHLLKNISFERIRDELCKMLMSDHQDILITLKKSKVLDIILPEFIPTYEFKQDTPWHIHDVFMHTNAVLKASNTYALAMKLALLFHDLEKVNTKTYDEQGVAHFIGHAHASALLAKKIMRRLKFDNKIIKQVYTLIEFHDYYMYDTRKSVHKLMHKLNGDFIMAYQILKVQLADNMGKNQEMCIQKNRMIYSVMIMLKEMEATHECFTIKDLKIDGNDLITLGFNNQEIGNVLEYLLKYVLNQQEKNTKEHLLSVAGGYRNEIINRK